MGHVINVFVLLVIYVINNESIWYIYILTPDKSHLVALQKHSETNDHSTWFSICLYLITSIFHSLFYSQKMVCPNAHFPWPGIIATDLRDLSKIFICTTDANRKNTRDNDRENHLLPLSRLPKGHRGHWKDPKGRKQKHQYINIPTFGRGFSGFCGIHPARLTWNLRIQPWKRKIIFQTRISTFYVNLPGCEISWFPHCMMIWSLFCVDYGLLSLLLQWLDTVGMISGM